MGHLRTYDGQLVDVGESKEIKILFIGNSLTQDAVAYLPYMLHTYYPEIEFKIYLWYIAGAPMRTQYTAMTNDTPADIFSVAENSISWTNYNDSKTMRNVLSQYTFDVVCIQDNFEGAGPYTAEDLVAWNNVRDFILANYAGGNALKFIAFFFAPQANMSYATEKLTLAYILQNTIADDMISAGIATKLARDTSLNDLGDQGGLSPDGMHAQEGLPCLLQTYTIILWLLDKFGIPKSIYGSPARITTEIYTSISVPGANLGSGVITGTDAQNILAQEVAIKAYKEGKKFVIENLAASE